MSTAAGAVVDLLEEAGVTRCYTVPGESFLELMDEVDARAGMSLISTRHESGAAFMAEADAKVTGQPAVAMATRAVGAANLAIGIHTAYQDSTPMLVLLGQVETEHLGKEAFQEVDLPDFLGQICVYGATVHRADRAAELVSRAYRASTGARPGPAVVALPADLLSGACAAGRPPARPTDPVAEESDVSHAYDLIASASRPVAIVGEGASDAHETLTLLAERLGIGVYTAFRRQDVYPNLHPNYLGHLTLGTAAELLEPLREADVVLVLGSRLDEVTTQAYQLPGPHAKVIQVDRSRDNLGHTVDTRLSVHAAPTSFADALARLAERGDHAPRCAWTERHAAYLRMSDPARSEHTGRGVDPAAVIGALSEQLPDDAIVANDAGNFSVFGHRYWRFTHPRTQVAPISGAMGYAVPAAVGASLAAPDRTVVALVGDGGFLMTGQELETAVRCDVSPVVVVFQNRMYGTIAMHQARSIGRLAAVDIGGVDLEGYARALGATARSVSDQCDLDATLHDLLDHPG
ncbi:MAG: thiamine pyrophosphate-dependent enzyme, partial [Nocardioidaceae bacterium]